MNDITSEKHTQLVKLLRYAGLFGFYAFFCGFVSFFALVWYRSYQNHDVSIIFVSVMASIIIPIFSVYTYVISKVFFGLQDGE